MYSHNISITSVFPLSACYCELVSYHFVFYVCYLLTFFFIPLTTLSKKYPTLDWENKVLYLGGYNT
jgi:hypothetical protein